MENCLITAKRLLETMDIPFTRKFLKEKILCHPQYPSLLSLSDTFEEYGVESIAGKLDHTNFDSLPLPCVVQVQSSKGSYFYTLTGVFENTVSFFDENGKSRTTPRLDFLKVWTGVVLLIDKNEGAAEPEIAKKLYSLRIIQVITIICAISFTLWLAINIVKDGLSEANLFYLLLKFLGLSISGVLLWYQQNLDNPILQKFCSGGKMVDCGEVLNSKAFQWLEGRINPSLVSFSYFFSGLVLLTFLKVSPIAFLGWLSLAAIPVVIYSFYYQAIVVKKWCRFCILIQGVLVLEVMAMLGGEFWSSGVNVSSVFLFMSVFSGVIIGGIIIKPMLEHEDELYRVKRDLAILKSNKETFNAALSRSKKMQDIPQGIGIMRKGENSKYQIIKVSNPFCGPCSMMHPVLESLFDKGNVDLQILFSGSRASKQNEKVIRHLMALAEKGDEVLIRSALDDWHKGKVRDYEEFGNKYKMNGELELQTEQIKIMEEWCLKEKIFYTPTLFINGYELPKEYRAEDLKYLLD